MGKKAPKPDPQIGEAAKMQIELGKEQLEFSKAQWAEQNARLDKQTALYEEQLATSKDQFNQQMARQAEMDALTRTSVESAIEYQGLMGDLAVRAAEQQETMNAFGMDIANRQMGMFEEAAQRESELFAIYEKEYRPFEVMSQLNALGAQDMTDEQLTQYMQSAGIDAGTQEQMMTFRSAQKTAEQEAISKARGEVSADIQSQAQIARDTAQRQMSAMGVDPRSGRFQGQQRAQETQMALASAGAQTTAGQQARDMSRAQAAQGVMNQANFGRGMPQLSVQQGGLAQGYASGAMSGTTLGMSGLSAASGIASQGLSGVGVTQGLLGTSMNSASGIMGSSFYGQSQASQLASQYGANTNALAGAYGVAGNQIASGAGMLQSQYEQEMAAYNASQAAIGSVVGAVAGAYTGGLMTAKD